MSEWKVYYLVGDPPELAELSVFPLNSCISIEMHVYCIYSCQYCKDKETQGKSTHCHYITSIFFVITTLLYEVI